MSEQVLTVVHMFVYPTITVLLALGTGIAMWNRSRTVIIWLLALVLMIWLTGVTFANYQSYF